METDGQRRADASAVTYQGDEVVAWGLRVAIANRGSRHRVRMAQMNALATSTNNPPTTHPLPRRSSG
jgi:hypothetical protein